jgi:hypothetical protein
MVPFAAASAVLYGPRVRCLVNRKNARHPSTQAKLPSDWSRENDCAKCHFNSVICSTFNAVYVQIYNERQNYSITTRRLRVPECSRASPWLRSIKILWTSIPHRHRLEILNACRIGKLRMIGSLLSFARETCIF